VPDQKREATGFLPPQLLSDAMAREPARPVFSPPRRSICATPFQLTVALLRADGIPMKKNCVPLLRAILFLKRQLDVLLPAVSVKFNLLL